MADGERGIDDLTNYVTAITIVSAQPDSSTTVARTYLNRGIQPPAGLALGTIMPQRLDSGRRIIGLLSTPSVGAPGSSVSNHVTAYVLALNGNATDKVPQQRRDVRESAFNYRMTVELTAPVSADSFASQTANLHDLRLMFRWPVQPGGKLGGGRAVYRAAVSGQLSVEEDGGATLHFFDPTTFALAQ
ncbi:MAG: hypothetical protein EPO07_19080 [Verrucomicrobia bacterium]|nr:MAG: hypothetical protein EPO07_19080 [Verrucomicrobiota bacterium]